MFIFREVEEEILMFSRTTPCIRTFVIAFIAVSVGLSGCVDDDSEADTSDCFEPGEVPSTVEEEVTLEAGCYEVANTIDIDEGMLTLEPGTTLVFHEGVGIEANGGRLNAEGTESSPIVLTGLEEISGYWDGVWIYDSTSNDNVLDQVTIEYGGGGDFTWADQNANLTLHDTLMELNDVTLRQADGFGLYLKDGDNDLSMNQGTFTDNEEGPVWVDHPTTVQQLDPEADFTGNSDDYIQVGSGELQEDTTWETFDIPLVARNVEAEDENRLTIEAGNTIRFREDGGMQISGGQLAVEGTEDDPVVLEGWESAPGYWNGIWFYNTFSEANQLDHVEIYDGGREEWTWAGYPANLTIQESRVGASNLTLANSGDTGILVRSDTTDLNFDCATITNEDGYEVESDAEWPCD